MNREVLLNYMRMPSLLAGASLSDLEKLTTDFPYSSITHLLYVKALSEQKSIHFHSRLKLTAAHVFDRSVLYYLINPEETPTVKETAAMPSVVALKQEVPVAVKTNIPGETPQKEIPAGLDALILQVKALSTRDIPALDDLTSRLSSLEKDHVKRVEDIAQAYLALREIALTAHLPEPVSEDPVMENPLTGKLTVTEPVSEEPATEKVAIPTEIQPIKIDPEITPPATVKPKHSVKKADLIDKFIETAPSMPKPKKDFFSPSDMAHTSTVDKEDLVSETLAAIHLKQGNIQKALKIYQRLCLIIPEKNTYFAAQIEKIKKENNLL